MNISKWAIDKWDGIEDTHLLVHMGCNGGENVRLNRKPNKTMCPHCKEKPPYEMVGALNLVRMGNGHE